MNKNWLTYLLVGGLIYFNSCGSADYAEESVNASDDEFYKDFEEYEAVAAAEFMEDEYTEEASTEGEAEEEYEEYNALVYEQELVLKDRAIQKVQDLLDYIQIISNNEYDYEMRESAYEMLIDLHGGKPNEATLTSNSLLKEGETVPLADYYSQILNDEIEFENFEVVYIHESLIEDSPSGVECLIKLQSGKNINLLFHTQIVNEEKQFGSSIEEVWTVLLRDIIEFN